MVVPVCLLILASTLSFAASVSVQLNAYDGDGTNTHTGRLGARVSIIPTVRGATNTGVTWSLSGAGSLSTAGLYSAPTAMPANKSVVITARSKANTAVTASYSFTLINPLPSVRYATGWPLLTDTTTAVTVTGAGFVPGTLIYVNGTAVSTTYQSWTSLVARIWIPYSEYGSVQVAAKTTAPGGGSSSAISVPIKPLVVNLNAFDENGTNSGIARLGSPVRFRADVTGSANPSLNWTVSWSLQGAGSISSGGLYQPPAAMPSNTVVMVIATLTANPKIYATYQLSLMYPLPVVNAVTPTHLPAGTKGTITLRGTGFVPGSQVLVNGSVVGSTYKASNALTASVTAGQATHILLAVRNPNPGGATSPAYSLQVENPTSASATVGTTQGRYVQSNFIGLSHEWGDAQWFMGSSASGVNTIYRQLVQNLINPGPRPFVIRVGGGTSDVTGYPRAGVVTPMAELARALPVHFTLGVNLASNNVEMAKAQAQAYLAAMPAGTVDAIEIGNEPDNYAVFGRRPSTYSIVDYLADFAKWKATILTAVPSSTRFMGAAWGSMLTLHHQMTAFNAQELKSVPTFSQHAYGEYQGVQTYAGNYLLSSTAATQGPAAVADYVQLAHQKGQMFRIGELNSVDAGGTVGVSDVFGSALWAIDTMFEYAQVGVDGVNWHGTSGCTYCAVTFSTMNAAGRTVYSLQKVNPLYYGLLFFHMATENTARLLPVELNAKANLKVWATMEQNGVIHVIILNKDESFAGNISISLPGHGTAQVVRLVAPSYESKDGISLGGQTFDGSVDGKPLGTLESESSVPTNGTYTVSLQPTGAVMLTVAK